MFRRALKVLNQRVAGGSEKYYTIDLLRGLASMLILVVHYKHFFQGVPAYDINAIKQVVNYDYWEPIYHWGANAVQLFWLISGFVFLHVYGSRAHNTWRSFLLHRVARLYPLHLITLLLIAVIQMISFSYFSGYQIYGNNDLFHFLLNLFFTSEWGFQDGRSFNGPIWSVSVEIFSYLIFFVGLKYLRLSILSIILVLLGCLTVYFYWRSMIILCLIYFFSGCLCYALMTFFCQKSPTLTLAGAIAIFIVSFWAAIHPVNLPKMFVYIPLFSSLVCTLALLEQRKIMEWLNLVSWVGNTSYGNYLWHSPLQMIFLCGVSAGIFNIEIIFSGYFMLGYVALVTCVSIISFHFFEKPSQRFINRMCK